MSTTTSNSTSNSTMSHLKAPRFLQVGFIGLVATAVLSGVTSMPAIGIDPVPGSAGIDTSLPKTNSAVTVKGRAPFQDLEITVNQTKGLVNQAVSITWKGATPTERGVAGGLSGHNFLQIMQCWGDDDGTIPGNPGPPPEQCVYGATQGVYGGRGTSPFDGGSQAEHRVISQKGYPNFDPAKGVLQKNGWLWKPFRAVDGTVVDFQTDPTYNPSVPNTSASYWINPFFDYITTNEIVAGRTRANGTGEELFEVHTAKESSGLGCGKSLSIGGASPKMPKCWLVIVPRGNGAYENVGTWFENDVPPRGVMTSPLTERSWNNRIAIPLEFNPIENPCSIEDAQRRIAGTELLSSAISSWQPKLCATSDLPSYSYTLVGDSNVRRQLLRGGDGSPGMIAVSRPIEPSQVSSDNPVIYAPLGISGVVVGFNIERSPYPPDGTPESIKRELELIKAVRVAKLNLTPRLVAKLLTQSYRSSLMPATPHEWLKTNPQAISKDPDFLQFNPEFNLLNNNHKNAAGLVVSAQSSDASRQVWEWILSDPEAREWLKGSPDAWGMKVNPIYNITPELNSSGVAFGDPIPDWFPKSDEYCKQELPYTPVGAGSPVVPPPLCGPDYLPYAQDMTTAARMTRVADDGARIVLDETAIVSSKAYKRDGPQIQGSRTFLSLTNSASAFRYGIQTASLSRAGDYGSDRKFVAPDIAGLSAGVASMAAKSEPSVLEPDPTKVAPNAYPLTMLVYGAVAPLALDKQARNDYAAFIEYAAGEGQTPGYEYGKLPSGYAPLPKDLQFQAASAAKKIRDLQPASTKGGNTPGTESANSGGNSTPNNVASSSNSSSNGSSSAEDQSAQVSKRTGSDKAPSELATQEVSKTTTPSADNKIVKRLKGMVTPVIALAGTRFFLPVVGVVALLSLLGALVITGRTRFSIALGNLGVGNNASEKNTSEK